MLLVSLVLMKLLLLNEFNPLFAAMQVLETKRLSAHRHLTTLLILPFPSCFFTTTCPCLTLKITGMHIAHPPRQVCLMPLSCSPVPLLHETCPSPASLNITIYSHSVCPPRLSKCHQNSQAPLSIPYPAHLAIPSNCVLKSSIHHNVLL